MVEVPKNKSNSAFLETLVVTGLFMSAFYFLFFEEIDEHLKKLGLRPKDKESDTASEYAPLPQIDMTEFQGREEFCIDNNPDNCIRGYRLPNSIEDLNFINGKIAIITKQNNGDVFNNVGERAMIFVGRNGNQLTYEGWFDGSKQVVTEKYDDVKNKIILVKNTYLKTI